MTKAELMVLFPGFSPKRAFRKLDDGPEVPYEIVGKWVRVAFMAAHPLIAERTGAQDTWDVFLCNTRDMFKGMGTGKLNNLLEVTPEGITPRVLDGEAFWQCRDTALVQAWLEEYRVQLGIRKRRPAPGGGSTGAVLDGDVGRQYGSGGSELSTGANRSESHLRKTPYSGPRARKAEPPVRTTLPPAEARAMDDLLRQQAIDRGAERRV